MRELDEVEFEKTIRSGKLVVIDFWAKWCMPCRLISPLLESLAKDYTENEVLFAKVEVDEHEQIASKYQIMSVPTIAFFFKGQKIHELTGARSKVAMKNEIANIQKKLGSSSSSLDIGIG